MSKYLLIATLLLAGCAQTVSSVDAVCSIKRPTFTEAEVRSLSDVTLFGVDRFFAEFEVACEGHGEPA